MAPGRLEADQVSIVLLRLLEYQSGIVILTTNREFDFDSAFHSRIHVSMKYDDLTQHEKETIWRREIDQSDLNSDGISNADIAKLGELDLDGRTIKNVVHVLKLYLVAENSSPGLLTALKEVLVISTANVRDRARKQVEDFCRT
jgi:hypothetical protein